MRTPVTIRGVTQHDPALTPPARLGLVHRVLGTSRFLIILAVLGTFLSAATLMVFGILRSIDIVFELLRTPDVSEDGGKHLIVNAVAVIDIFLLGTVLYIISAGLYQLFVDDRLSLPRWLHIGTLDDLKAKLTGVIVVGMLVTYLGSITEWTTGDTSILALGAGIAAVIIAIGVYYKLTGTGAASEGYRSRPERADRPDDVDR
jgi:uncharacterized membrane protein YqhA